MSGKRMERRIRRRLRVVFGEGGARRQGYTTNLSAHGLSISSTFVYPAGSHLHGRVTLGEGVEAAFTAQVRWVRKLRSSLVLHGQSAMGLTLLESPGDAYFLFVGSALAPFGPNGSD